jgi:putative membrane protein
MFRCLLGMYVAYHMTSDSTKFGGEGIVKYVYYFILFTHIVLSVIITIGFDYIR